MSGFEPYPRLYQEKSADRPTLLPALPPDDPASGSTVITALERNSPQTGD